MPIFAFDLLRCGIRSILRANRPEMPLNIANMSLHSFSNLPLRLLFGGISFFPFFDPSCCVNPRDVQQIGGANIPPIFLSFLPQCWFFTCFRDLWLKFRDDGLLSWRYSSMHIFSRNLMISHKLRQWGGKQLFYNKFRQLRDHQPATASRINVKKEMDE